MLRNEPENKEGGDKKPGFFVKPTDQPVASKEAITQKDKDRILAYLKSYFTVHGDTFIMSDLELNKMFSSSQDEVSFSRTYTRAPTETLSGMQTEKVVTEKTTINDWSNFLRSRINSEYKAERELKELFQKIADIKGITLTPQNRLG